MCFYCVTASASSSLPPTTQTTAGNTLSRLSEYAWITWSTNQLQHLLSSKGITFCFHFADESPTLTELLSFPTNTASGAIDITEKVGTKYIKLGLILLQDDDGSVMDQIISQYQLNATNIVLEILKRWIRGRGKQPVTWNTLIDTLRTIGLTELASSIHDFL